MRTSTPPARPILKSNKSANSSSSVQSQSASSDATAHQITIPSEPHAKRHVRFSPYAKKTGPSDDLAAAALSTRPSPVEKRILRRKRELDLMRKLHQAAQHHSRGLTDRFAETVKEHLGPLGPWKRWTRLWGSSVNTKTDSDDASTPNRRRRQIEWKSAREMECDRIMRLPTKALPSPRLAKTQVPPSTCVSPNT